MCGFTSKTAFCFCWFTPTPELILRHQAEDALVVVGPSAVADA